MIASDAPAGAGARPRVAVLEARMNAELVGLLARHGAEAWSVRAVVEAPVGSGAAVRALIDALTAGTLDVAIVLTGAGVRALVAEAEAIGREDELLAGLRRVTIACRRPKPVAVLKRLAVPIARVAREPHTTAELLDALSDLPVDGMGVAIVHYGERNEVPAASLERRVAGVTELLLYEWLTPDNTAP